MDQIKVGKVGNLFTFNFNCARVYKANSSNFVHFIHLFIFFSFFAFLTVGSHE